MFKNASEEEIEDHIEEIYDQGIVLSNYYTVDLNDAKYYKTDSTIIIQKEFGDFSRHYFLTSDIVDLTAALTQVSATSIINFPTKDAVDELNGWMNDAGYKPYRIYETYYNPEFRGNDVFVPQFASEQDFDIVKSLLYGGLDIYADHLPNDEVLMEMIRNKEVLTNIEDGKICGIFIFKIQSKKCYFNFWADIGKNGLFLIFNMYNYLKEQNISYSYLWVNVANEKVKRIHKLFGSIPNGIKDYIYIK